MLRKIEYEVLIYLKDLMMKEIGDYEVVLALLREERKFLVTFVEEKVDEYNAKFSAS